MVRFKGRAERDIAVRHSDYERIVDEKAALRRRLLNEVAAMRQQRDLKQSQLDDAIAQRIVANARVINVEAELADALTRVGELERETGR